MGDTIFLLNNDGELVEMIESHYLTEKDFQKLLADYPKLISGDQINSDDPRRWILITREMGVADAEASNSRWSLDHLFIDQDGIPTLVEVKRSTDTRIRREVIGQMLDYAANAVSYWTINDIINQYKITCETDGKIADEILAEFLFGDTDFDKFWGLVDTNLKAGKIRMLLIADVIPKEMRRIIEFLNEQMTPCEILGVEIKQYVGQNLKTLVPRVIGATAKAQTQKATNIGQGQQWNEELFLNAIRNKAPTHFKTFTEILNRSKNLFSEIWWGNGSRTGSFIPGFRIDGHFYQLFGGYTPGGSNSGGIELKFQYMKVKPPYDSAEKRDYLRNQLAEALQYPINTIETRPNIPIQEFEKPGVMDAFFSVVEWYLKDLKTFYNED